MIWQLALGTGCIWGIERLREGKTYKAKKNFNKVLENIRSQVYNVSGNTYHIKEILEKPYGFHMIVEIPFGNSYENFEKLKEVYETNLHCTVEMEKAKNISGAYVKLIYKGFEDKEYKPVESKPYEIFLGYDLNKKPLVVNMNRYPHLLIAGETGTGKSRLFFIILTNLIHNHNEKQISIYLVSIAKRDHKKFKVFPQVKGFAENIDEAVEMYYKIQKIMNNREDIFDKSDVENIEEYNAKYKKNQLDIIYIFADEFSFYQPDKSDEEHEAGQKAIALALLKQFIKRARALGIFIMLGIQVTNADEMPILIRRQTRTHVTFFQKEPIPSKLIIGSDHALTLGEQEAIVMLNKDEYKIKTPKIDKEIMSRYLDFNQKTEAGVKAEPKEVIHVLKSENIPSTMTWQQYLDSKNKVIDYTQKIGQYERGRKKKGVLIDANSK